MKSQVLNSKTNQYVKQKIESLVLDEQLEGLLFKPKQTTSMTNQSNLSLDILLKNNKEKNKNKNFLLTDQKFKTIPILTNFKQNFILKKNNFENNLSLMNKPNDNSKIDDEFKNVDNHLIFPKFNSIFKKKLKENHPFKIQNEDDSVLNKRNFNQIFKNKSISQNFKISLAHNNSEVDSMKKKEESTDQDSFNVSPKRKVNSMKLNFATSCFKKVKSSSNNSYLNYSKSNIFKQN